MNRMKRHNYLTASALTTVVSVCSSLWLPEIGAAHPGTGEHSRVVHSGLRVEFSPQCSAGVVQLLGTITNETLAAVTIESGSLPWQYDVLGSEFSAEASGKKLKRNWTAPLLGRVGPITLAPHEHRTGVVPIATLFPDLSTALRSGAVVVHWKYLTNAKAAANDLNVFADNLVIRHDPCVQKSGS
jgi:hypothetical protein